MRNPQIKVALAPRDREILEWGAALLGAAPATYARELLAECLQRVLDDPQTRRVWAARPRRTLEELMEPLVEDGDPQVAREIRESLRPRRVAG